MARAQAPARKRKVVTRKRRESDASWGSLPSDSHDDAEPAVPQPKRRRRVGQHCSEQYTQWRDGVLLGLPQPTAHATCGTPSRLHPIAYHRPLLLDGDRGMRCRQALLAWFDDVSAARLMPWRKAWLDPAGWADADELRRALERRAYEVWISEIMLQQTRVSVVIDYWNRWMARWPTVQDLAAANADDVLSAWRGLGYYSRATRIYQAAKLVVEDPSMRGLLPDSADQLESKVPGVGRYTAGAISAIVFGRAAPMVDGNVMRVLSRQLGIFGNVKTNRTVIDALWAAAEALVRAVALDPANDTGAPDGSRAPPSSDRPGKWGQALMELGSTVCTPKPDCSRCPITATCRAYAEGLLMAGEVAGSNCPDTTAAGDIEDLCQLCEPFERASDEYPGSDPRDNPGRFPAPAGGPSLSRPARTGRPAVRDRKCGGQAENGNAPPSAERLGKAVDYARRFPVKTTKKAVREEEVLVCAVRRTDGQYLICRRPDKGLLAGLWELPSHTLPSSERSTARSRKRDAQSYVGGLVSGGSDGGRKHQSPPRHLGELGSVPWLFSHLRLTMHVHLFCLDHPQPPSQLDSHGGQDPRLQAHGQGGPRRWATAEEVERESMGTGMRKCWAIVGDA